MKTRQTKQWPITRILNHKPKISDNAYNDSELMTASDRFIKGDNPLSDKIKALRQLNKITGTTNCSITVDDVERYIQEYT